jgi:hypothetical protein
MTPRDPFGLAALAVDLEKRLHAALEAAVRRLHARAVELTPVDSGHLRANVSLGHAAGGGEDDTVFDGASRQARAEAAARRAIERADAFRFDPKANEVVIYNNVPYAADIEHGSSRQAPAGVIAVLTAEWPRILAEEAKKAGLS